MRAAGVSLLRVGGATVLAGAALGLFAFVLGDWIAPASENAANALRDDARGESGSMARSLWLRDGDQVLRIRRLESENHARDLTVYRLSSDGRIASASMIDEASYSEGHWRLHGVHRTDFGEQGTQVSLLGEVELEGGIAPTVLKLFVLEANSLSVGGLLRLIGYMDDNHIDAGKYRMLLWRRLVEPLTVAAMMLFAVPFVSGRMRDAGAGARMLFGVLVGIVFYVGNKVAVSLGEIYEWPAPLAASFPTLVLGSVALWSLRRAR
jgi:lipopolysaccharide export system permease protein